MEGGEKRVIMVMKTPQEGPIYGFAIGRKVKKSRMNLTNNVF
jgi:hypothetical protein